MNACPASEASPRRLNPWSGPQTARDWARWGLRWHDFRLAWEHLHGGRCARGTLAPESALADDTCTEHPAWMPVAVQGDLVEAAGLWFHAVPDGTPGRVVYVGADIDGYPGAVIAWTTGRSTTHDIPLRLPRAAAPTGWALSLVGDHRWTLNPARRPKLELP